MPKTGVYHNTDLSKSIVERVQLLQKDIATDPDFFGFDTYALRDNVRLISATPNKTEWELDILPHLCNKSGNLHGGAACTILDNLTSTALLTIARPGFLDGGHVSRTITMTYLRPVPKGAKVKIVCEVVAAGKHTANVKGEMRLNDKICVTCIHDKAVFARQQPKL